MDLRAQGEGSETISSERLFQRGRDKKRGDFLRIDLAARGRRIFPALRRDCAPDRLRSVPTVKLVEEMIWQKMIEELECKDCVLN